MRAEVMYRPDYSMLRVELGQEEQIRAESGAMVAMSGGVDLVAQIQGGFLKSLARSVLGGESFFTTVFSAGSGCGEVLLAPQCDGDIEIVELDGRTLLVQSGCYLAGDAELEITTSWGGARGFFGGLGLVLLRVSGAGLLYLSSFGALRRISLEPGGTYIVDTGHVVAFPESMPYKVTKAAAGWGTSLASGELLVCEFTGPGDIYIQTRNPLAFAGWIDKFRPRKSSDGSSGGSSSND